MEGGREGGREGRRREGGRARAMAGLREREGKGEEGKMGACN